MNHTVALFVSATAVCLSVIFMGECRCEGDGGKMEKAEKPRLTTAIPLVPEAPSIDGIFDPKEWEKASCVSGFVTTGHEWAPEQSAAYLTTDGKDLFLAMRCLRTPPFLELKAKKHPADSMGIFGDESVEIFMMPDPEKNVYYHFAINAVGSIYTAKCAGGTVEARERREVSWSPKMEAACGTFDGGWVLETKIDLSSMAARARLGDKWKVNFARHSSASRGSWSSWTGQSDFNSPALFGSCVVSQSGGLGYSLETITMSAADLVVRNAKGEPRECRLAIQSELGVDRKQLTVPPFSATPVRLNTPGGAQDDITLSIECDDSQSLTRKSAFWPHESVSKISVAPSLYYCRPGETISSTVDSRFENDGSIKVAVLGPGQTKPFHDIMLKSGEKSFSLDTKGMKPGRHVISVVAEDVKGQVLGTDQKVFVIVKEGESRPLPEKQKIELDGRLIRMNGKLFFPFMAAPDNSGAGSPLADDSFNVRYWDDGVRVRKNALTLEYCGYPSTCSYEKFTHYEIPSKDRVIESLKHHLEKGGNAGVFCRRLQIEAWIPPFRRAEGSNTLDPLSGKEEYTDCYRFIKKTFPETLVSIQNDREVCLPEFVDCADMIEVATPSSYAEKIMRNFAVDLEEARATVGDKPMLLWISAFSEFRSAENIRAATWLAVVGGANGIIYHMGHGGVARDKTRYWSVFNNLGRETEVLYPIVATGEKVDTGFIVSCDSPYILLSARKFQGHTYVIAVSKATVATKARIKTGRSGKSGLADRAEVLFEGRSVQIKNGEIEDVFTAMEPHLYRMK